MANSFYQCNYVIRKGKFKGNQCLKSAGWQSFCSDHDRKLYKRNYKVALLEENNLIHNYCMIGKCLRTYHYLSHEVVNCDKNVLLLWLNVNNQGLFILKSWLITNLSIDDINNIIKTYYYDIEYDIIFNKINH